MERMDTCCVNTKLPIRKGASNMSKPVAAVIVSYGKIKVVPQLVIPAADKPGIIAALDAIRALLGNKGQNWITGEEHDVNEDGVDQYCLFGAIQGVDGKYEQAAQLVITLAVLERDDDLDVTESTIGSKDTITDFNDFQAQWKDIKDVIARAKQLVQQAATR